MSKRNILVTVKYKTNEKRQKKSLSFHVNYTERRVAEKMKKKFFCRGVEGQEGYAKWQLVALSP